MQKSAVQQSDLLEGPLLKRILLFVLPLICTNLLQSLYNAADMIIVGYSGVEGALGSIGTTTPMINLIQNVFIGFSVGGNVVVARFIGARDQEKTGIAVHTVLCTGVLSGLLACVLGQTLCRPVLIMMGDEGEVLELATLYCRLYFAGIPFIAMNNFCNGIFRAKGDTRTPMLVMSASGLLNVLLNMFFVFVCGLSVDGVAIATIVSMLFSSCVMLYILSKTNDWCRVDLRKLHLSPPVFREVIRVGLPAGIQSSLYSVSNMLIQSSIIGINNRLYPGGSAVIDGHSAASSVENVINQLKLAVHQAAVTFTSQHCGAKKYRRITKVAWNCYFLSISFAVVGAVIIMLFREPLVGLYVHTPEAVQYAYLRLSIMLASHWLLNATDVGAGLLRGMGRSMTGTVISLLGVCVFRVAWILTVLPHFGTLECVYMSYPISWFFTAVASGVAFCIVLRRKVRSHEADLAAACPRG